MKYISIVIILIVQSAVMNEARSQKPLVKAPSIPANYSVSALEMKLYEMINVYRSGFNLPPIPISGALSFVASTHVKDLYQNHPDQSPCNFHSWSDRGPWKPFCYPRDEKKNNSVWDKPKELTGYKGKGYEIIYWENNAVNIDSIIPFWNSIDYFNSFLLNTGKWQDKKWMAIGIGIYENYASAWFGEFQDSEHDTSPTPKKRKEPEKITDTVKVEPQVVKKTQSPAPEIPIHGQKVQPIAPEIAKPVSETYYIIISSQQPRAKSNKLAADLISKGYPDAKVLAKDNKVRVSIAESGNKAKADSILREIKKVYKGAWIYKQ